MDILAFLTFALIFTVAAATPGPGVAALVARALGSGMGPTAPMIAGYILGDLVFLTGAVLGLSVIAAKFGLVFVAIKYAGALYLIYIAYRLWTNDVETDDIDVDRTESPWRTFLSGLAITLGNPKVIIFYLALLPQFVDLAAISVLDYFGLAGVIVLVLGAVLLVYVALAAKTRALFGSRTARRRLNRGAGTIMAGVALGIVSRS